MRLSANIGRRLGAARRGLLLRLALAPLLATLALLPSLWRPDPAAAHPLGNFTVNRYSRLELSPDALRVRYVLDAAEIPTFQAMPEIDANGDGRVTGAEREAYAAKQVARIAGNLRLTLDGAALPLRPTAAGELELLPGQAGLQTMRLSAWLEAPGAGAVLRRGAGGAGGALLLEYGDGNEPEKIGWREIVVRADGVTVGAPAGGTAGVPTNDVADELRRYPEDMLLGPLNVRELRLSVAPPGAWVGRDAGRSAAVDAGPAAPLARSSSRGSDGFAELFGAATSGPMTPGVVALALLSATILGGMHSMSPGHGKTIVGAYLVGARGTPRHALFLGLTVTVVHTAGVFALGLATLLASRYVIPERVYPWMSLVSGLLVMGMGVSLFRARLRATELPAWPGRIPRAFRGRAAGTMHGDPAPAGAHCGACAAKERLLSAGLLGVGASGASAAPANGARHTHHGASDHAHNAHDAHDHGFGSHSHAVPGADGAPLSWRGLLALGVSGGLLPCPSALVVMLGAIALQQVGFGLVLITFFSLGLAGTLVAVGLLMVYSGRLAGRLRLPQRLRGGDRGGRLRGLAALRYLPVASAGVVGLAGLALSVEAVRQLELPLRWETSAPFRAAAANALSLAAGGLGVFVAMRRLRPPVAMAAAPSEASEPRGRTIIALGHAHDHDHRHEDNLASEAALPRPPVLARR